MRLLRATLPQLRVLRTARPAEGGITSVPAASESPGRGGVVGGISAHAGQSAGEGSYLRMLIRPYEGGRKRGHSSAVEGGLEDVMKLERLEEVNEAHRVEDDLNVRFATRSLDVPISPWPRGTWDDPVPITSVTSSRAVACCGPPDGKRPHSTVWVNVTESGPVQCPTCRQVFKLSRRQS